MTGEDRLVIHRSGDRWIVGRVGEFPRVVASFASLHEAEVFVLAQSDDCTGCGR